MTVSPVRQNGLHRRALWWRDAPSPPDQDGLAREDAAEVVIVGAGFLGLTTAWHLARRCIGVLVLEAGEVGSGASGVNAGFVVPNFAKADPAAVIRRLGSERGAALLRLVGAGGARVFDTIRTHAIPCAAEQTGWLHLAHSEAALAMLRPRAEAWARLGRQVRILARDEARALSGARFCAGALLDESGGMIDPHGYVTGLAALARGAGARIAQGVTVDAVERDADGWRVTHAGGRVWTGRVILCTNAFRTGVAMRLARTTVPLRVYQAATAPLAAREAQRIAPGRHPAADTRANLFTYRLDRDNRLISGGMSMLPIGASRRMGAMIMRRLAEELALPGVPEPAHVWAGTAAMTVDFLPRIVAFGPGFFGGIGCNGRGIAMTAMLGEVLADVATGTPLSDLPVPAGPARALPFAPLAALAPSLAIAQARWADRRLRRLGDRQA